MSKSLPVFELASFDIRYLSSLDKVVITPHFKPSGPSQTSRCKAEQNVVLSSRQALQLADALCAAVEHLHTPSNDKMGSN